MKLVNQKSQGACTSYNNYLAHGLGSPGGGGGKYTRGGGAKCCLLVLAHRYYIYSLLTTHSQVISVFFSNLCKVIKVARYL